MARNGDRLAAVASPLWVLAAPLSDLMTTEASVKLLYEIRPFKVRYLQRQPN
jgi:hypothetical protein